LWLRVTLNVSWRLFEVGRGRAGRTNARGQGGVPAVFPLWPCRCLMRRVPKTATADGKHAVAVRQGCSGDIFCPRSGIYERERSRPRPATLARQVRVLGAGYTFRDAAALRPEFPCTPACAGAQCSNRAAVDLEPAPQAVGREAKEKRK
jgi:hypothetical protein